MALWGSEAERVLLNGLKGLRGEGRKRMRDQFSRAVDYLKGNQKEDTRALLDERFPSTQQGDTGQQIAPVTVGLTGRYAKEAATIYNRPVKRTIVNEDGSPNTEATELVVEEYKRCRWDEVMHANDRLVVTVKTNCILHEPKRGALRPRITYAHDVYPVVPSGPEFMSAEDPDDYQAFVIELFWATEDAGKVVPHTYLWHDRERYIFFEGNAPDQPTKVLSEWVNPYRWYQTTEELDPETGLRTLKRDQLMPGRMLTFWNTELPVGELIIDADADVVEANRELNVAWSMIFDLIRWQGGSIPVLKTNARDTKNRRKHGVRFPLLLRIEEQFEMVNGAVDYTGQVEALKTFGKLIAVMKSMSPNDFSTEGQNAVSGFAKLVDSLPKLEAREDRVMRCKHMEEREAWPRNAAILVQQGLAPESILKLRMQCEFADIEFPKTEDERSKKLETDVKYHQTNPVEIMMMKYGLDEAAAIEKLEKNAMMNRQYGESARPQQPALGVPGVVSSFGGSIRQRSRPERDNDGNARPATRRDRQSGRPDEQGKANDD